MNLPSVIALKNFIKPSENPNFTRFNVFLRDKFTCQYCGDKKDLTFDHLLPKSKGGLHRLGKCSYSLFNLQCSKRWKTL